MRWFFLFLLALNVFYYVWHQQQSPLRAKEIAPLELYKDGQKNILLLAESNLASRARSGSQVPAPSVPPAAEESIASESACLYLGGGGEEADARRLQQRLLGLDIEAEVEARGEMSVDYWVYLPPLASRGCASSVEGASGAQYRQLPDWRGSAGQWHFFGDVFRAGFG